MLKPTYMYLHTTCRHYVHISYCSLHICIHILYLHITHRCTPVCTHAHSFLHMHIYPSLTSQPPHKHTLILDHTHTHYHTHALLHTLFLYHIQNHTHALSHTLFLYHTRAHTLSHTFSLTHSLPVTHTHTHPHTQQSL